MIDRDIYFDIVRDSLFNGKLTQEQVDGQTVILAVWDYTKATDVRHLAYMLATVYHECAVRMWPITEYGSASYLQSKDYYPYIGRGFVQLTWEANYKKAGDEIGRDLVGTPELALDCLIATRVLFHGMKDGWFTGRKLDDYFTDTKSDPVNARQIINGNDDDELIAGYYDQFLDALEASSSDLEPAPEPAPDNPEVLVAITQPTGVKVVVTVDGAVIGSTVLDS